MKKHKQPARVARAPARNGAKPDSGRRERPPSGSPPDLRHPKTDLEYGDLAERKRAEEAIRQSELRYRTLFDLVPVAVYACDADGLIQEFNQRAVELWGREPKKNDPREKFCGSFKIFSSDGRSMPHAKCPMARALKGETLKSGDLEILVERPDGSRRKVIVNPRVLRNERGKIAGAINCFYDVTERRRAHTELEKTKGSLETR